MPPSGIDAAISSISFCMALPLNEMSELLVSVVSVDLDCDNWTASKYILVTYQLDTNRLLKHKIRIDYMKHKFILYQYPIDEEDEDDNVDIDLDEDDDDEVIGTFGLAPVPKYICVVCCTLQIHGIWCMFWWGCD